MKRILSLVGCSLWCTTLLLAQTDATKYIQNPSLESGFDGWVQSSMQLQSNSSFSIKAGSTYAEKWVSSGSAVGNASLKQTVKNLPAGVYRLTVAAQNLNQANTSAQCEGAYVFAGEKRTKVYTPADYSIDFDNYSGEIEIGFVASSAKGNWIAVDNFRLEKMGEVDIAPVFASLQSKIEEAEALYDAGMNDAENFKQVISQAKEMHSAQTATADEILQMMAALDRAMFVFHLANPTAGAGTAPKVSKTHPYVVTGVTEALMRATMTGSNVMEKGVCWSTDRNPTVLDNRATDSYTLNGTIFHIKGLKPATVYYLRPYYMNKTYQVAYGDEIKIVTHAKGTCTWSWDEAGPDAATNDRCRTAVRQTIDYFNEWTGIKGFHLSGHYVPGAGAGNGTADCSYGGWMRISQNTAYQAIGTVLHETGHGVGVGTSSRYADANVHSWKWFGRECNTIYSFLENKDADPYNSDFSMVGDGTHAWGQSATYDWFVNGADKDKHTPLQYIGGCALLYGMFVDGLCPTTAYINGLAGYTYNFDDEKNYYLMCKDAAGGCNEYLLCEKVVAGTITGLRQGAFVKSSDEIPASAAWKLEYNAETGCYRFRNAGSGKYIKFGTSVALSSTQTPGEEFEVQLMPDRTDVTLEVNGATLKTHGYWMTWVKDKSIKAMTPNASKIENAPAVATFDYSDKATKQQWIILTEEELALLRQHVTAIEQLETEVSQPRQQVVYNLSGQPLNHAQKGLNIVNGRKTLIK